MSKGNLNLIAVYIESIRYRNPREEEGGIESPDFSRRSSLLNLLHTFAHLPTCLTFLCPSFPRILRLTFLRVAAA